MVLVFARLVSKGLCRSHLPICGLGKPRLSRTIYHRLYFSLPSNQIHTQRCPQKKTCHNSVIRQLLVMTDPHQLGPNLFLSLPPSFTRNQHLYKQCHNNRNMIMALCITFQTFHTLIQVERFEVREH